MSGKCKQLNEEVLMFCQFHTKTILNLLNLLKTFYRGLAYDATASPQRPKGAIQRITSTNPNSEESPFHDPTGKFDDI